MIAEWVGFHSVASVSSVVGLVLGLPRAAQRPPIGRRKNRLIARHQVVQPRQEVVRAQLESAHLVMRDPNRTHRITILRALGKTVDRRRDHEDPKLPRVLSDRWVVLDTSDPNGVDVHPGLLGGHPPCDMQRVFPGRTSSRWNVISTTTIRFRFLHQQDSIVRIDTEGQGHEGIEGRHPSRLDQLGEGFQPCAARSAWHGDVLPPRCDGHSWQLRRAGLK